jgi:hypothetical protein
MVSIVSDAVRNSRSYICALFCKAMSASSAGMLKTTWKYPTGSRSASRAASHSRALAAWHFGQCRLRQLMGVAHYLPYGQSR